MGRDPPAGLGVKAGGARCDPLHPSSQTGQTQPLFLPGAWETRASPSLSGEVCAPGGLTGWGIGVQF